MYEGYKSLAAVYDSLVGADYDAYAAFIEREYGRICGKEKGLFLDLACGTGKLTKKLADAGFDMIGVDGSADMLARAERGEKILYLCQEMTELELYGTVRAAVCTLDGMNYLTEDGEAEEVLRRLRLYIEPGGMLLFDANSPYKFRNVYGDNVYALESEDGSDFCVWQNAFDEESSLCDFYLTVFERTENGTYRREDEVQTERMRTEEEWKKMLFAAGFTVDAVCGDTEGNPLREEDERMYFICRRK